MRTIAGWLILVGVTGALVFLASLAVGWMVQPDKPDIDYSNHPADEVVDLSCFEGAVPLMTTKEIAVIFGKTTQIDEKSETYDDTTYTWEEWTWGRPKGIAKCTVTDGQVDSIEFRPNHMEVSELFRRPAPFPFKDGGEVHSVTVCLETPHNLVVTVKGRTVLSIKHYIFEWPSKPHWWLSWLCPAEPHWRLLWLALAATTVGGCGLWLFRQKQSAPGKPPGQVQAPPPAAPAVTPQQQAAAPVAPAAPAPAETVAPPPVAPPGPQPAPVVEGGVIPAEAVRRALALPALAARSEVVKVAKELGISAGLKSRDDLLEDIGKMVGQQEAVVPAATAESDARLRARLAARLGEGEAGVIVPLSAEQAPTATELPKPRSGDTH